jgi:hypothetical protein
MKVQQNIGNTYYQSFTDLSDVWFSQMAFRFGFFVHHALAQKSTYFILIFSPRSHRGHRVNYGDLWMGFTMYFHRFSRIFWILGSH